MITISFRNGSQLIVNLQKPLQEIWLAARSGGYHYRHDGRAWVDTKTGEEFFGEPVARGDAAIGPAASSSSPAERAA